jgi:hypothetical protein
MKWMLELCLSLLLAHVNCLPVRAISLKFKCSIIARPRTPLRQWIEPFFDFSMWRGSWRTRDCCVRIIIFSSRLDWTFEKFFLDHLVVFPRFLFHGHSCFRSFLMLVVNSLKNSVYTTHNSKATKLWPSPVAMPLPSSVSTYSHVGCPASAGTFWTLLFQS